MKLSIEQIEKISRIVLDRLKEKDLVVFKTTEDRVLEKVHETILKDLKAEDNLDREVEEILKSHTGSIDSGKIDYRKMFGMIKGKLARERGIIL
ncbi:MAG: DUF507 family protein [Deltaproteobacteria bacterium]|nr:DUF507 family protein [Deltaproteobacteria bacterium]